MRFPKSTGSISISTLDARVLTTCDCGLRERDILEPLALVDVVLDSNLLLVSPFICIRVCTPSLLKRPFETDGGAHNIPFLV